MALQLAGRSFKFPHGIVEDVLVKIENYFLPTDFVVLDMEESYLHSIILGRPFLATARALIDVEQGEPILRIHDEHLTFHVFKPASESEPEPKELKYDHSNMCTKESNSESAIEPLKQSLVNKQEIQEIQQLRELKKELKPQELGRVVNKEPPDTIITGEPLEEEKRVVKKLPRGWRNKKIPTEGFSFGDKVISAHHPPTPPHLPTIPSQLPQVFTIRKVLSLEHVEIIKESSGDCFIVRGEDLRHYNPP
ncbi:hypothetical protein Ahy_B01g054503 isoform B [Arachis hypogaea]|nr:hypothetical protein Ahy_B01g054503 isoform B [Arachis hypogaea]